MNTIPLPTDVSIITTYRCCMKCQMCNIWKHPSDIRTEIQARDLETLPRMKFVNITGGEPFVRNDLGDIIEVAFTKAPRVVISTAGFHVDEILALADRFPNIGIRVSIEGLSTINDFIRGRDGGFDRGMRTLLGLRQKGVKDIGIATTISQTNCHELMSMYQLTRNMNMDFATASFHNSFYFHKEDNYIDETGRISDALFDLADELLKGKHPKDWFRAFFNLGLVNYVQGRKRMLPCEAGTVNFFIEPNGDVYPCNGLEERYWKKRMGNIKQDSFEDIWFGDEAQAVRRLVSTCPKNCWMVGTAAPVMKKYIKHPLKWVITNKLKSLMGKKIDRTCLPDPFDVGQSPEQGDLRGQKQFLENKEDPFPMVSTQRVVSRVLGITPLSGDSFLLRVQKGDFRFKAGQHVSIGPYLKYYKSRDYTLCSAPSDPVLEFMVKKVKKGEISPWLTALVPGELVELVGPYGDFILSPEVEKKHLFIATGVGIGPFKSMMKVHPNIDYQVIHGIRTQKDLCLAEGIPSQRYISCITREAGGTFRGRVTDYLTSYPIPDNTRCYLCGNPYMLKQVNRILLEKGIPKEEIQIEPYYTY